MSDVGRDIFMPSLAPEPPADVRIKFRNGAVVPCDVKYTGEIERDGHMLHAWKVLNEGPFDHREGDQLQVGHLPIGAFIWVDGTGPGDYETTIRRVVNEWELNEGVPVPSNQENPQ
jgi:hypothetical protein